MEAEAEKLTLKHNRVDVRVRGLNLMRLMLKLF